MFTIFSWGNFLFGNLRLRVAAMIWDTGWFIMIEPLICLI
jgi:hypothetical protein